MHSKNCLVFRYWSSFSGNQVDLSLVGLGLEGCAVHMTISLLFCALTRSLHEPLPLLFLTMHSNVVE